MATAAMATDAGTDMGGTDMGGMGTVGRIIHIRTGIIRPITRDRSSMWRRVIIGIIGIIDTTITIDKR